MALGYSLQKAVSESGILQNILHTNDDKYVLQYSGNLCLFNADYTKNRDIYTNGSVNPVTEVYYDKAANKLYAAIAKSGKTYVIQTTATDSIPAAFESSVLFSVDGTSDIILSVDSTRGKIFCLFSSTSRMRIFSMIGQEMVNEPFSILQGSDLGRVSMPQDMEIDSDGNVYISDTGNSRIHTFSNSGTPQARIGAYNAYTGLNYASSEDGCFKNPGRIYIRENKLYVIDTGNYRVQRLSLTGDFESKFGVSGLEDKNFGLFKGISVDSQLRIFVVDYSMNKTKIYQEISSPATNVVLSAPSSISANSARFDFAAVPGATEYKATFGDGSVPYGGISKTNSVTIGNIIGARYYSVRVQASNDAGLSPLPSNEITFLTKPDQPGSFAVVTNSITQNQARVQWVANGDSITSVKISWKEKLVQDYSVPVTIPFDANINSYLITDLSPSKAYDVRASLVNASGESQFAYCVVNTLLDQIKDFQYFMEPDPDDNAYTLPTSVRLTFKPPTDTNATEVRFYINSDYTAPVLTVKNTIGSSFYTGLVRLSVFSPEKTYTVSATLANASGESLPVTVGPFTMSAPRPIEGFDLYDEWIMAGGKVVSSDFSFETSPLSSNPGAYIFAALEGGVAYKVDRNGIPAISPSTEGNGMLTISDTIFQLTKPVCGGATSWTLKSGNFVAVSATENYVYILSNIWINYGVPSGNPQYPINYYDFKGQVITKHNLNLGTGSLIKSFSDGYLRTGIMARSINSGASEKCFYCSPSTHTVGYIDVSNNSHYIVWDKYGTELGWFNQPFGIAVDRSGNIYVSESGNHRVQKLEPIGTGYRSPAWNSQTGSLADKPFIGKELRKMPVASDSEDGFNAPKFISINKFTDQPSFYVYDSGTKRVKTFSWSVKTARAFGSSGYGTSVIKDVSWLSCDSFISIVCDPTSSGARRYEKKFSPTSTLSSSLIRITEQTTNSVKVSWGNQNGGGVDLATYYKICINGTANTFMTDDVSIVINKTSPNGESLQPGRSYSIRIAGANAAGTAPLSDAVVGLTLPAAPSGLRLLPGSATESSLKLVWSDNGGIEVSGVYVYCDELSSEPIATITDLSSLQAEITGLSAASEYHFRIQSYNDTGSSEITQPVKMGTLCAKPKNIAVSNISASSVKLTWDPSNTASKYRIYIVGVNDTAPQYSTDTVKVISNLNPGKKYYFRIQAVSQYGDSLLSDAVSAITIPAAPSGLSLLQGSATTSSMQISKASNGGEVIDKINVFVREKGESAYKVITDISSPNIGIADLSPSSVYHIYMTSENASGCSEVSQEIEVKTICAEPVDVQVVDRTASSLSFSWASVPSATSYKVILSGDKNTQNTIPQNRITIENLTPGSAYTMTVAAINESGISAQSQILSSVMTKLNAVEGLTVTKVTNSEVTMAWSADGGSIISGFQIVDLQGNIVKDFAPGQTRTVKVSGLTPGSTYSYKMRSYNSSDIGESSAPVTATTRFLPPTGLVLDTVGFDSIAVKWDSNSEATSYKVTCNGTTVTVLEPKASITGLQDDTVYTVSVCQVNAGGDSDEATVDVLTKPAAAVISAVPGDISASSITVSLQLSHLTNHITSIKIYVDDFETTYDEQDMTEVGTKFTISNLRPNKQHSIRVRVANASGLSELSNILEVRTKKAVPACPAAITVANITPASFRIIWDTVEDANEYRVHGLGADAKSTTSNSFDATELHPSTVYHIQVSAVNESGESVYSQTLKVTTKIDTPKEISFDKERTTYCSTIIKWQNPNGAAKDLKVPIFRDGVLEKVIADRNITETEISGLIDSNVYGITMACVAADGSDLSESTPPLQVLTKTEAPSGIMAYKVTNSSVKIVWNQVFGADSYKITGLAAQPIASPVSSKIVDSLVFSEEYTIKVIASNATGDSAPSAEYRFRISELPYDMMTITLDDSTDSSLTIAWENVLDNTGYTLYMDGIVKAQNISLNSYVISGLEPNKVYKVRVQTQDGVGLPRLSRDLYCRTTGAHMLKARLNQTDPDPIKATSANIAWDAITGATSYKIYVGAVLAGTVQTTDTVQQLLPGTSSIITVEAYDSNNTIIDTSSVSVTTDIAAPSGLLINPTESTASTITLHWTEDGGTDAIVGFKAYMNGAGAACKTVAKDGNRTIMITDLQPYTEYSFAITAYNESMESEKSTTVVGKTKAQ